MIHPSHFACGHHISPSRIPILPQGPSITCQTGTPNVFYYDRLPRNTSTLPIHFGCILSFPTRLSRYRLAQFLSLGTYETHSRQSPGGSCKCAFDVLSTRSLAGLVIHYLIPILSTCLPLSPSLQKGSFHLVCFPGTSMGTIHRYARQHDAWSRSLPWQFCISAPARSGFFPSGASCWPSLNRNGVGRTVNRARRPAWRRQDRYGAARTSQPPQ